MGNLYWELFFREFSLIAFLSAAAAVVAAARLGTL
jgi:hypothetical protein